MDIFAHFLNFWVQLASFLRGPRGLTFTWWGRCGLCIWHKPSKLAHSFLFCSCVCFCLYGPFDCISFHKFSRQFSAFSLGSSGLISASLVLSTIYLFMKVSLSPDRILCGWLGLKHQATSSFLRVPVTGKGQRVQNNYVTDRISTKVLIAGWFLSLIFRSKQIVQREVLSCPAEFVWSSQAGYVIDFNVWNY